MTTIRWRAPPPKTSTQVRAFSSFVIIISLAFMDLSADDPSSKRLAGSRRKSTGNPQDEARLLKRKEQNRAAQRAFRERKEKHVKDLEDKVAALEAKNDEQSAENDNLKDLLNRLQQENLQLKQAQFTFTVPKPSEHSNAAAGPSKPSGQLPFNFFSPMPSSIDNTSLTMPSQSGNQSQSSNVNGDIDWNSLTTFDSNMLSVIDDVSSDSNGTLANNTNSSMQVDNSPYGQYALPSRDQYKTIANNPLFMSFAETPDPSMDLMSPDPSTNSATSTSNAMDPFNFNFSLSPQAWTTQSPPTFTNSPPQSHEFPHGTSLDELFGGSMLGGNSPLDFNVLVKTPSMSPVSHATRNNSTGGSSTSSQLVNGATNNQSSSPASQSSTSNSQSPFSWGMSQPSDSPPSASEEQSQSQRQNGVNCLTNSNAFTREVMSRKIAEGGQSPFSSNAGPPPIGGDSPFAAASATASSSPMLRKIVDTIEGNFVNCEGTAFPRTEQSEQNIEVLKAWRSITSHPCFKDADINQLCTEFTKKARCDGTKVVLEPSGVHHILETFKAKSQQQQETN